MMALTAAPDFRYNFGRQADIASAFDLPLA